MEPNTQEEELAEAAVEQVGVEVDQVTLDIDYHIIEHFSKHLYSSPNKAIEELVINGYDAGADWVRVYVPGAYTQKIIVWDDGESMDVEGIKKLWKLADSPKSGTSREILDKKGVHRKVIGKFGIGKIASYTVGDSITHYCKTTNGYFLVAVDYNLLMDQKDTDQTRKSVPIQKLSEEEAKSSIIQCFSDLPLDFESFFVQESWTFAVIDKIKREDITQGRLRWVIGNALPVKPDFKVYVDDLEVVSKLLKTGISLNWNFGQEEIKQYLDSEWKEGIKEGSVDGSITYGTEFGLNKDNPSEAIDYVSFPELGKVWGYLRLYKDSLFGYKKSEEGRSHGFFIFVRDRLVNLDDAQLFLRSDPSFLTFYNAQFILHIDGLDEDLLADRERITEGTPKVAELEILQNAVYKAINKAQRSLYDAKQQEAKFDYIFPVMSPSLFMEPLAALWVKNGAQEELGFDFKDPKINTQPISKSEHVSTFSVSDGFKINSLHPYYQKLQHELGSGKISAKAIREFEIIAVSELLFEGHLYDLGVSDQQVRRIMLWRDDLYRKLSQRDKKNPYTLTQNLMDASYKSGEPFETALVEVLKEIGFNAERDGASGKKDVFVKAYCGDESYKLIFEAKAMTSLSVTKALKNDDAETGGANAHRTAAGADHAVIISRKFAGFENNENPAILQECSSMGNVSIMTVEALNELLYAVKEHAYSLDTIKPVFTEIETPKRKLERIENLSKPFEKIDSVTLLNQIWESQGNENAEGVAIPIRGVWLDYGYKKMNIELTEFRSVIEALRTLAYPLVQLSEETNIYLIQSPENIINKIRKKLNVD
ncbi:ATP-binding protein [Persicitalea jodogahamensis]|uniref:Uncharacterized protein n=1 Tax=Persicitalea jodogahamensis TaxID=402147 RepID=A0A8J3GBG2_9BACT|nr:ATP-binding protein [Persicitalea jodogahamensis]GHB81434.1 hypothetical protein GCM10007390_40380 [Persicitalea jodogahamensis]